jgi:hypothetical protein
MQTSILNTSLNVMNEEFGIFEIDHRQRHLSHLRKQDHQKVLLSTSRVNRSLSLRSIAHKTLIEHESQSTQAYPYRHTPPKVTSTSSRSFEQFSNTLHSALKVQGRVQSIQCQPHERKQAQELSRHVACKPRITFDSVVSMARNAGCA